ncbi:hypothetical protein SRHO_G00328910 [Serrasalmus rhombeus]
MGKISIRSDHKGRSDSAQRGNDGREGQVLTQHSPSTLRANLSAVDGGLVTAPAFSHNTVSGDVNIVLNKIDVAVTPTTHPVINKNKRLAQEALDDDDTSSKTILRTPKNIKRKPQMNFRRRRGKGLHSARVGSARGTLTFDDVEVQPDRLDPLEDENEEEIKECVHPPGGHVLTSLVGEITGTRVTADYFCSECDSAVRHFRAKAFSVKCTKCRHSWKCAKLPCTCTAEVTIELSDRTKCTVVLSDSLLRSIVSFEREGHCNTDKIEEKVLKLGNVRVDFMDGHPKRVERIAADHV